MYKLEPKINNFLKIAVYFIKNVVKKKTNSDVKTDLNTYQSLVRGISFLSVGQYVINRRHKPVVSARAQNDCP